ncbi:hypothetical protein BH23CHL8_BH23CHL8_10820 [soil metagenome]
MAIDEGAASPVHAFAERAWEQFLAQNPLWATSQGDERWDDRLGNPGSAGRAAELAMLSGWEAEMEALGEGPWTAEDAVTLDLIRVVVRRMREAHAHRLWQLDAIDQYAGPQGLIGDLARVQRLDTPERVERLLARLTAYPEWLAAHARNTEEGLREGRTAARPVVERCLTQTRRIVATPVEESPLLVAHPDLGRGPRAAISEALEARVRPAQAAWLALLERYLDSARSGEGVCHLPGGDALYGYHVLAHTTLEETPASIHAYGLARLAEIEDQERAIASELGQPGVAELRRFLDADPGNHVVEGAELVRVAEGYILSAESVAPRWFGRLPRDSCGVRSVEPHMEQEAPPAFYLPPDETGSRKGAYFINTWEPASRHLHRLAATTFHEAVPGHHFQIAIEQELIGLPTFRRFGSRLAGAAYVEGWGLYAEQLAGQMGLYETTRERFGALESEAWRAARLVVDTGIHAMGWSRQRSIDLLRERAGLSALEAETETDRYISWPGQALAYMIGQREILALRARLEERDGAAFDPQAFHDAVLGHGALPLATLRAQLPAWVARRGA